MDALRFLGGVRPAAPPQPPVAPASVAPPPIQRHPRAALPRLWPRGERQGAATSGEVRGGEEAGTRPDAEDRRQGNWVLQMLRVQPRWVDAADAEAAGGGGGGGRRQDDEEPAVVGGERCASCGGGGEEEGCAVGTDEFDGEVFDRASFSRLLRKVSIEDAKEYSRMSYLCNIAYMIPKIQVRSSRHCQLHPFSLFNHSQSAPHEFPVGEDYRVPFPNLFML
jgi:hypothetical protein